MCEQTRVTQSVCTAFSVPRSRQEGCAPCTFFLADSCQLGSRLTLSILLIPISNHHSAGTLENWRADSELFNATAQLAQAYKGYAFAEYDVHTSLAWIRPGQAS